MKEKPGKYGILIRMISDSDCRYVVKMEVYSGRKDPVAGTERGPSAVVKRLVESIKGSARNVTTDRYYTGVDLAEELFNSYNLPRSRQTENTSQII